MIENGFKLKIFGPGKADVLLAAAEHDVPWTVLQQIDQAGIRVVGEPAGVVPDEARTRTLLAGCAGAVCAAPAGAPTHVIASMAEKLGLPRLEIGVSGTLDVRDFVAAVLSDDDRIRPYAFMIGRLERDFCQARDALRVAVESEAGLPCLWVDDGLHRTNIASVRERTRLLIKHATFVIADLTLGIESPKRENPSRAHEIGMAIAYERPLMLSSQEPRRYPYFSIGDMQMSFWSTEDELDAGVRTWIRSHQQGIARRVYNYELADPTIARPEFSYDPTLRYVGPRMKRPLAVRRWLSELGLEF